MRKQVFRGTLVTPNTVPRVFGFDRENSQAWSRFLQRDADILAHPISGVRIAGGQEVLLIWTPNHRLRFVRSGEQVPEAMKESAVYQGKDVMKTWAQRLLLLMTANGSSASCNGNRSQSQEARPKFVRFRHNLFTH